ncbi:MAG: hypothetical protein GY913_29550 [Proteobacteria bacterium]|nr:hypothetical protein [Pseudomonadota bacterium]
MTLALLLACFDPPPPPTPAWSTETVQVEKAVSPIDPQALEDLLASDGDAAERGRAIVTLAELGRGEELFRRIQADPDEPEILRIWAAAGRIQLADADELDELEPLVRTWPSLERPLRLRRAELGGDS